MPQVLRMWSLGDGPPASVSYHQDLQPPNPDDPSPAPAPFRLSASLQGLLRPTGVVPAMSKMPNVVPKALKWRGFIYFWI